MEEEELIKERKKKVIQFLKKNYNSVTYILLATVVFIAVWIRTRNLSGLRDVTTGGWTLGPDLDPFLFLRWSKYIIANGSLMLVDKMRYVPLGIETKREYLLHPYMMAWFHKIAILFGSGSAEQSAVLYPVFFFAITVVAFFFFAREIFIKNVGVKGANVIGLISAFFLSVIPALLPRTIAGIPEKESAAFFFMFIGLFLFLKGWRSRKKYGKYVLIILSAFATFGIASIWGGNIYVFLTLSMALFVSYFFGKIDDDKLYLSVTWIISSFAFMLLIFSKYSLGTLITSIATGSTLAVVGMAVIHKIIYGTKIKHSKVLKRFDGVPPRVVSFVFALIVGGVAISLWAGPMFIPHTFAKIFDSLVKPATSRLIQTVAENRQPYFSEWSNSFGPSIGGFPVFFWLFFTGSVYLFWSVLKEFGKKERIMLVLGYLIFLVSIIFSRYSSNYVLNGENFASLSLYFLGTLFFAGTIGYYYFKYYKEGKLERFERIDFGVIVLLSFFVLGILSARGAVRFIMMLVPPASIIVSYFVVNLFNRVKIIDKGDSNKLFGVILVGFVLLGTVFAGYQFYLGSNNMAKGYIPSSYTQQWQYAMSWVRENVREDAVFGHWWDYGYWVQSIGERATVLDGGNMISNWNHMMGRYALTGSNEREALEFLYAHNTTHFLIDSTDIGKYAAFSSIGSDTSFDRRSWIPTIMRDERQTYETKNETVWVYTGGTVLDEDILYEDNGTKIFLPGGSGGLGGIVIGENKITKKLRQPVGVFVYAGNQYRIPLRYAFYKGELIDFESGLDAGIFIMPKITQSNGRVQIDEKGTLLYLSRRVVHSQFARLYLFGEEGAFKLVHSEDDFVIKSLKNQGLNVGDIAYFQGLRGPLKIWEIEYPEDIEMKDVYLETSYLTELKEA